MKSYAKFKKQLLGNKHIKRAYDELGPEFEVATLLIRKRLQCKITQKELAEIMGTRQSAISRFESGTYNPSVGLLYKIAEALDAKLKISINSK